MGKKFKIAYARFFHESHSFSIQKTTIEKFKERELYYNYEILKNYINTKTETGAFIDFVKKHKDTIEALPIITAAANPSGIVTRDTYQYLFDYIINNLKQIAGNIDGLYLSLHGAMVAEGVNDPESDLLKTIRSIIKDVPIAITLDLHANVDKNTAELSDILIGYKTYPHTDQYETGEKAMSLLFAFLKKEVTCINYYKKLPLMPPSMNMLTSSGPMADILREARKMEDIEGVNNIAVFGGFPYCDVENVGMSIVINASQNTETDQIFNNLSSYIWGEKEKFIVKKPGPEEAIMQTFREKCWPIALVDFADNPGSCGSADTTGLLRKLVEMRVENVAFAFISDAASVEKAISAGVGQEVVLDVGGKVSKEYGEPVRLKGIVKNISDGIYYNKGPWATGLKVQFGRTVVFASPGIDIIITEGCQSPNDPQIFRRNGLEPTDYRILALKAKNHFRPAFESIIKKVIPVDVPGVSGLDLTSFNYQNVPRPIWPLDNFSYVSRIGMDEEKKL